MNTTWRKSSRSAGGGECVELRGTLDAIRDSKAIGTTLHVPTVTTLIAAIKSGTFDH